MRESMAAACSRPSVLFLFCLIAPSTSSLAAQTDAGQLPRPTAMQAEQSPSGFTAHNDYEVFNVTICSDSLVHVVSRPIGAPPSAAPHPRPWMLDKGQSCPGATFQFTQPNGEVTLTTPRLPVSLNPQQGNLTFKTTSGEDLVREHPSLPRTYLHSDAPGLYHIEDRFDPDATEGIYGLGQHQAGLMSRS
jgi:alpha-D-xyloside xylohydrolase